MLLFALRIRSTSDAPVNKKGYGSCSTKQCRSSDANA